ncbi:MAG: benzoyl-CoA 2,3-epoxidase subunit BoxB, partial [Streptosporangiaceae bacterium]
MSSSGFDGGLPGVVPPDEQSEEIVGAAPAPDGPVSIVDYSERIPNNVGLATDRKLQRALESWQPRFLDWWSDLGPSLPTRDVYLRTAIAIGRDGWANWGRVPMEDYRWGIFLSERNPGREIAFGQHKGEPAWQEVPGEYRADLRRLLVVQGDTEPASVEQQRFLGRTAPSLYDLRNLFQVNVEEGRHLWAMVYLLHAYFGRDGREEAEQLLRRHSGDLDSPRILGAFNEQTSDWLSFFMFTYFTDRDGKYQLGTLKESGFDPLSRTCEFMLREEAHHMFVGTTGVQRIVRRTAQLMAGLGQGANLWAHGAIPLEVIQKYLNFQFAVSLDLFGSETSSNVAAYFTAGLKGRWMETRRDDDHELAEATMTVPDLADGAIGTRTVPLLTALNLDLRNEYVADCARGLRKWNAELADAGLEQRLTLPHEG